MCYNHTMQEGGETIVEKRYSLKQAGDMLGIKVRTVRQWIRDGKLNAQKYDCSNRWFIAESEIVRLTNDGNKT